MKFGNTRDRFQAAIALSEIVGIIAIAEAFQLLDAYHRQQKEIRFEKLKQEILVGTEEMKQGKTTDGEIVFARLQDKVTRFL